MAYNTPGYIDVTRSKPVKQEEWPIMPNSTEEEYRDTSEDRFQQHPPRMGSPRFPYAIVWTPIPVMTWIFPFLGHMGICTSDGVIRDFAGSYYVSEDRMAFGNPTRYLQLQPDCPPDVWDTAISDAACSYKTKTHNLCWDNCHSMVALALNNMKYKGTRWNAWKLGFWMFFCSKFVGVSGFLKTFAPFIVAMLVLIFITIFSG
ncbi:transmembrane protein 222 [Cimex lectularius]|uniref:Transmembrane protein 222 n=1 Tax=Cimex lectularius TaxID=79782 RepID=A0A8I6TDC6_CIMLE|nr:transmembrane protein 222 [Cimex lectularius]